jgi:hypothetical protein
MRESILDLLALPPSNTPFSPSIHLTSPSHESIPRVHPPPDTSSLGDAAITAQPRPVALRDVLVAVAHVKEATHVGPSHVARRPSLVVVRPVLPRLVLPELRRDRVRAIVLRKYQYHKSIYTDVEIYIICIYGLHKSSMTLYLDISRSAGYLDIYGMYIII